jgi:hypothetical protein
VKILASDRETAKLFNVSAYGVAQARELHELANSNHPLAGAAQEACGRVLAGELTMTEAYKLVKRARSGGARGLLSAQIDLGLLNELKALAKDRKQLFRDLVEEMVMVYLMASKDSDEEVL